MSAADGRGMSRNNCSIRDVAYIAIRQSMLPANSTSVMSRVQAARLGPMKAAMTPPASTYDIALLL